MLRRWHADIRETARVQSARDARADPRVAAGEAVPPTPTGRHNSPGHPRIEEGCRPSGMAGAPSYPPIPKESSMRPSIPKEVLDVFPHATPERLELIRRARPLASLTRGWAQGVPENKAAGGTPRPNQVWGCLGPLEAGTRWVCTVTADRYFDAQAAAARELGCEPGQVILVPES